MTNSHQLEGVARQRAIETIKRCHYTHSVSSGKTHYFQFEAALISFSIPANYNIAKFLLGRPANVWELTRLWAPDGHEPNLLTRAIKAGVAGLMVVEPTVEALVSYADPNVGHAGGIYRAASWIYTGISAESRYYIDATGQAVSRRKFHSGSRGLTKAEIENLGYRALKRPGKHRFARGLTRQTRRELSNKWRN